MPIDISDASIFLMLMLMLMMRLPLLPLMMMMMMMMMMKMKTKMKMKMNSITVTSWGFAMDFSYRSDTQVLSYLMSEVLTRWEMCGCIPECR